MYNISDCKNLNLRSVNFKSINILNVLTIQIILKFKVHVQLLDITFSSIIFLFLDFTSTRMFLFNIN